jgi:hypothetical protein
MALTAEQREQELIKAERIDALELSLNRFLDDDVRARGACRAVRAPPLPT